jgi:hypothetical protein
LVCLLFVATRKNSILWPRYQLFFTLSLYIAAGVGLASASGARLAAAAAAVLASMAFGLRTYYGDYSRGDWNRAAAYVSKTPAEPVIIFPSNLTYGLARYLPTDNPLDGVDEGDSVEAELASVTADAPGAWLALTWGQGSPAPERLRRYLRCAFREETVATLRPGLDSLRLTHYTRAAAAGSSCAPRQVWEQSSAPPLRELANIEQPDILPIEAGNVSVSGWAFSTGGMDAVALLVDGREVRRIVHPGRGRPDVAAVFADIPDRFTAHAGFGLIVQIGPGDHVLSLAIVHADGTRSLVGPAKDIRVVEKPAR